MYSIEPDSLNIWLLRRKLRELPIDIMLQNNYILDYLFILFLSMLRIYIHVSIYKLISKNLKLQLNISYQYPKLHFGIRGTICMKWCIIQHKSAAVKPRWCTTQIENWHILLNHLVKLLKANRISLVKFSRSRSNSTKFRNTITK